MRKLILAALIFMVSALSVSAQGAKWISSADAADGVNEWICFRKDVVIEGDVPAGITATVAADTKYWLWVNGSLAVFEGGLKRGPKPGCSYYDEIDLSGMFRSGTNQVAVLVCHFGKDGFSHVDSGRSGLYFDAPSIGLRSDASWSSRIHPAYGTAVNPLPNYRLPESNIAFDASKDIEGWQTAGADGFRPSVEISAFAEGPWGEMFARPIPQWKDYGIKEASFKVLHSAKADTVVAKLPYNMQMTPVITLSSGKAGRLVDIRTDHTFGGGTFNIRAEYFTRQGEQTYENLGWMNGEEIRLVVPKDVTVQKICYRETGYASEPTGSFVCDDPFYNRFWAKALRTLYVNMRDTFYDCPERERSQWWGDEVVLTGEAFYTYDSATHDLMKKGMVELVNWADSTGALHSPIPGNYFKELPGQMLASISLYGFWNYYMNTGDMETLKYCWPAVKKYLSLYKLDENGLTAYRKAGWNWGDWGDNKDMVLIYAGWHAIALQSAQKMAELFGEKDQANAYGQIYESVKAGYNKCWNGSAYRHPEYQKETDDRVQALAVLAGIAGEDKYSAIFETLKKEEHASPYMEKYVMEALFKMGEGEYAMERVRKRYDLMVNADYSTLYENWNTGKLGATSSGTTNHAWSGGPLTVIAGQLCGINPLKPAYKLFSIAPKPVLFRKYRIEVPTVAGMIVSDWSLDDNGKAVWQITVPDGTKAMVTKPWNGRTRTLRPGTRTLKGKFRR